MPNEIAEQQANEVSELSSLEEIEAKMGARHKRLAAGVAAEAVSNENPPNLTSLGDLSKSETAYALAGHLEHGSAIFRVMLAKRFVEAKDSSDLIGAMDAIGPRDGVEQILASQMAMVQATIQEMYRNLEDATDSERVRFYEGAINRLSRTFTAQMDALRKHRTGGVQTVKHVHVNEGGQAIVADTVSTTHVAQGEG